MKKTIKLLVLTLSTVFINCSSDDRSNTDNSTEIDSIIGKWKLTQKFKNGVELTITDCELNDFIEYLDNEKINDVYYEPNSEIENGCLEFIDSSGSWEQTSNSKYRIILDDGDINYTATINFSEDITRQRQSYSLLDGEETYEIAVEYEKIE